MNEGQFDDLPGKGKPIAGLDRPYDPAWWAKKFVERERLQELLSEQRRERVQNRERGLSPN